MVRSSTKQALLTGLFLGSIVLAGLGSPGRAEAKNEKWWTPDVGDGVRSERVYRRKTSPRRFERQWRSWRGQRIYRDVIVIRSGYRGPRYRAWRAYSRPEYIYSQRMIRVRPVRFHVAASIVIGGVHIQGNYVDPGDYEYGCNFCDARFGSYDSYHAHVRSCGQRPHGYRVEC